MIVTTTTAINGRPVTEYVGVVTGEAVLGANVFRDLFAGLRDIVGGRSGPWGGWENTALAAYCRPTVSRSNRQPCRRTK